MVTSVAVLALSVTTAMAGQINLYWNDCLGSTDPDGAPISTPTNKNFNCAASTSTEAAIGSFILSNAMADFVSTEVTMDLQAETATLPAWWTFDPAPGACHDGSLSMTFDFSILIGLGTACQDPFGQPAQGGLANYTPTGNRARIIGVGAISASNPRALLAGTQYYGLRLGLKRDLAATCTGCSTPVAIVLNTVNAVGVAPGSAENCSTPATNQCVTYQAAGQSTCLATPALNATWGQIKNLYR